MSHSDFTYLECLHRRMYDCLEYSNVALTTPEITFPPIWRQSPRGNRVCFILDNGPYERSVPSYQYWVFLVVQDVKLTKVSWASWGPLTYACFLNNACNLSSRCKYSTWVFSYIWESAWFEEAIHKRGKNMHGSLFYAAFSRFFIDGAWHCLVSTRLMVLYGTKT